jgi:SPP1 gp7 family putative phage head morphogenesis protein
MAIREKALRPLRPNVGFEVLYRKKLQKLVEEMHDSVTYWLTAKYRANQPLVAQDELPASTLRTALKKLSRQWQRRFDEMAPTLAEWFAKAAGTRSDAALRAILRDGGISVQFRLTPAMRDILKATLAQQVSLIKSIPSQYLTQVEGAVMRSVTAGRDLGTLAKELQGHYGVTKRRAALIARSQNNMATAAMTRVRQQELGLKAMWLHSGGGKTQRPTHVKQSGKKYDPAKGWYDPSVKQWIWPGILPNCRCVSRSVVPGLT